MILPMGDGGRSDVGSAGTVLVVCAANVCRSPLGALHLGERLRGTALETVRTASAGVRALEGACICGLATRSIDEPARAGAHRARQLTPPMVREADLVLTMDLDQRGAASRAAPGEQHTIFTLREAAALAEAMTADGVAPQTLAELAQRLHALRGSVRVVPPAAPPRRLARLRRPVAVDDGHSIADGHTLQPEAHARTIRAVRDTVDRFAAAVTRSG